jgi:hypothetical protein
VAVVQRRGLCQRLRVGTGHASLPSVANYTADVPVSVYVGYSNEEMLQCACISSHEPAKRPHGVSRFQHASHGQCRSARVILATNDPCGFTEPLQDIKLVAKFNRKLRGDVYICSRRQWRFVIQVTSVGNVSLSFQAAPTRSRPLSAALIVISLCGGP